AAQPGTARPAGTAAQPGTARPAGTAGQAGTARPAGTAAQPGTAGHAGVARPAGDVEVAVAGFARDAGASAGAPLVLAELSGIVVGERLRVDELRIEAGDRVLVSGPNGAGKTTLLRVLAGDLRPDSGTVVRSARVGYLAQELPPVPSPKPLLTAYAAGRPGLPEEYAAELLALGLFREEDLTVPVAALSVGQQRRLELARLVTRPADLLLLDEPTNHVALSLVEDLEAALAAFPGAVVVVSHDHRFRAGFGGTRLELRSGRAA
ncbi:ATP-binding cassette domain-containing protein, partial [Streptomyces sp. P9(2023)]|uniref:ATP-binding cassette domain-containing protein n=1 Tax=Streptomyces sp. P9(2023) TaxID=3064394 RepID=UPI0028F41794